MIAGKKPVARLAGPPEHSLLRHDRQKGAGWHDSAAVGRAKSAHHSGIEFPDGREPYF